MQYSVLVNTYEKLEKISSKLEKTDILADLLSKTPTEELPKIVRLGSGRVFATYEQYELGIALQMMIKAISKATGFSTVEVEEKLKKTGDLGLTVEEFTSSKKQATLLKKELTVDFVFKNLQQLAFVTGEGSQDRKLNLISELLMSAKPNEAKYIVRTILSELRIGVAEGIIRDAIVKAFLLKKGMPKEEKKRLTEIVEYAWSIVSDFGEVAKITKEGGIEELKKVKIQLGRPMQVMLGLAAEKIEDVTNEFGKVIAQYKYDGMRVIIEKNVNKFWLFTRRQEDVTKQFPDIVELASKCLKAENCIVEGEALGIDTKTDMPVPFQILGQRIHRKYDIEKMVKEIPVQINLFDVIYLDGEMLLEKPLKERLEILKKIVKPIPGKFQLAEMIVADDVTKLEKFYEEALKAKQEGIFLKVKDAPYIFGRHVGGWYKIKPVQETLDLAIVGATWGEGARARWLTSYILACKDPNTGELLECGMMSTGLNEEQYQKMTKKLKPLIINEKGRTVYVKSKIIIEVGYQEIQKSPNYSSGYALRFPRYIRERTEEKSEPDSLDRVVSLFKSRGKAG